MRPDGLVHIGIFTEEFYNALVKSGVRVWKNPGWIQDAKKINNIASLFCEPWVKKAMEELVAISKAQSFDRSIINDIDCIVAFIAGMKPDENAKK